MASIKDMLNSKFGVKGKTIVDCVNKIYNVKGRTISDALAQIKGWGINVGLAPRPTESDGIANNKAVRAVFFKDNTATIEVALSELKEFPSSNPAQGTHKWIALQIRTGITPITDVSYQGSALTQEDIQDAQATGCKRDAFVLYIKADEVVDADKVFVLSCDDLEDQTVTIKVVDPEAEKEISAPESPEPTPGEQTEEQGQE